MADKFDEYKASRLIERVKNKMQVFPKSKEPKEIKPLILNKQIFWHLFKKHAGKDFVFTEINSDPIYTIFRYFLKDKDFNKSGLVLNNASLDKGLYVFGDNGVGKTYLFEILHKMGYELTKYGCYDLWFSMISAVSFVQTYMKEVKMVGSIFNIEDYYKSKLYIDDLMLEGKAFKEDELMATILFERDKRDSITFITTNAPPAEVSDRYGMAIGDRLFKQFNFIHWEGDSFRQEL